LRGNNRDNDTNAIRLQYRDIRYDAMYRAITRVAIFLVSFFVVPVVGKMDINLQSHEFIVPKKEITSPADIASKWERSEVSFYCKVS